MAKKIYKVVSLFSGAMGLDLGLESTGRFHVLACVEKDPVSCETIRLNKRAGHLSSRLKIFQGDIANVDPLRVLNEIGLRPGEVDLLVGGPPCQSFSTAGKRGTIQDTRGSLLWEFLRFVRVMKPRFFLMENVRGLLSAAIKHRPIAQRPDKGGLPLLPEEEPGSVVRLFAEGLQKIPGSQYHMDCFEVNAVNYGAPQIRERALFIGNRYNLYVDFPDPTHGPRIADQQQQTAPSIFEQNILQPWTTLRDVISDLHEDEPEVLDFSPRKKRYLRMVPEGSNWRSLPTRFQKESMGNAWHAKGGRSGWWRRLTYDLPCPTLITMPNHASTSLCHPTETRALSVREYARIQEFPDHWIFSGTTAERYVQIGNAVPLRLGRVAGFVIVDALDVVAKRKWCVDQKTEPGPYRVRYIQSHVRTRQWYRDGETKVWKRGEENVGVCYPSPRTLRKEYVLEEGSEAPSCCMTVDS